MDESHKSNPCFEFWLLLHLCDLKKEYALCRYYSKVDIFIESILKRSVYPCKHFFL